MKLVTALIIILAGMALPYLSYAQTFSDDEPERRVVDRDKRPDLAVDYSQVARFKLASRKSTYHLGEIITLEVAILNMSNQPVFFEQLNPQFYLYDEQGLEIKIQPYGVACRALSPNSFDLIEPNYIITDSSELLVGCDEKAFDRFDGMAEDKDEKRIFENNLFVGYGSACLRITRPGTYKIKARQQGRHVIESHDDLGIKTAVGTIETAALKIKVIE